jgi:hypothetical protein
VTFRGDYWYSGIQMFLNNPFTGVGIDSYGDNYLKFRSIASASERDPNITSDVAHNVLIDFAANGGILLFLSYLFLNLFVLLSVIRVFRAKNELSAEYLAVLIAWIAFQAQSIISMNQIVVVTVGWVLAGLVLGFERQLPGSLWVGLSKKKNRNQGFFRSSTLIATTTGILLGFVISSLPLIGDLNWRASLESGDSAKVVSATESWPRNSKRYVVTAYGYMQFKNYEEGRNTIENGLKFNNMNLELWKLILDNPEFTEREKTHARKIISELDPQRK